MDKKKEDFLKGTEGISYMEKWRNTGVADPPG